MFSVMRKSKLCAVFTLIELIVAMGVFALLMASLMQFFGSAQSLWVKSSQNIEIYQNARILMELMTRDIQCIAYNNQNTTSGIYPFWFESNSRINFISSTDFRSSYAKSPVCVVKYAWANGAAGNDAYVNGYDGAKVDAAAADQINWVVRSCTSDMKPDSNNPVDAPKYNFLNHPRKKLSDGTTDDTFRALNVFKYEAGKGYVAEEFQKVVPYVVKFEMECKGAKSTFDNSDILSPVPSPADSYVSSLPSIIAVKFSLMDKTSWGKWIAMGGKRDDPDNDPSAAKEYRLSKQIDFGFSVYINNRVSQ